MSKGRFGQFGGQYAPETMMAALEELEQAYNHFQNDPEFNRELQYLLREYAGSDNGPPNRWALLGKCRSSHPPESIHTGAYHRASTVRGSLCVYLRGYSFQSSVLL